MEVGAGAGAGASPPPPSGVSSLGSAFSHQSGCAVNLHVSLTFTEVAAPHRETETARTTTRPRRQAAPAGEAMSIRGQSERELLIVSWSRGAPFISCSLRPRGFAAACMPACGGPEDEPSVWWTSISRGQRDVFHFDPIINTPILHCR